MPGTQIFVKSAGTFEIGTPVSRRRAQKKDMPHNFTVYQALASPRNDKARDMSLYDKSALQQPLRMKIASFDTQLFQLNNYFIIRVLSCSAGSPFRLVVLIRK